MRGRQDSRMEPWSQTFACEAGHRSIVHHPPITEQEIRMRPSLMTVALTAGLCTSLMAQQAKPPKKSDTAYASMQQRGKEAMGVDQYTSTHKFDSFADGGRIEL